MNQIFQFYRRNVFYLSTGFMAAIKGFNYEYYLFWITSCRFKDTSILLTKTPPAPAIALSARSTVSRLNGSRGSGRQLARYRAPPVLLTPV